MPQAFNSIFHQTRKSTVTPPSATHKNTTKPVPLFVQLFIFTQFIESASRNTGTISWTGDPDMYTKLYLARYAIISMISLTKTTYNGESKIPQIHLVFSAINLEERNVALSIDLVSRRVAVQTFGLREARKKL